VTRRIVVTGCTRGLGRALAGRFAALGHTVIGCGRSTDQLAALRAQYGAPHRFDIVDVSDDGAVARWAEDVIESVGVPDLLINNAGLINDVAPLWTIEAAEFDRIVDVNLRGVANVIRHFVPSMVTEGRGVIVNMSSGWGRVVDAGVAPYCATKFGVEGLSRALALDLPSGMAAVALNPGVIDTDMLRKCWDETASSYDGPEEWVEKAVPIILDIGPDHNGQSMNV